MGEEGRREDLPTGDSNGLIPAIPARLGPQLPLINPAITLLGLDPHRARHLSRERRGWDV